MKAVRDWSTADISTLPIGEFDWLEIKGRKGLDLSMPRVEETQVRNTLSKALSAFANSGGGQLIYGLVNPRDSWLVDEGGIALDMKRPSTREWLEDIISTLVDPPLRQFNVYVFSESAPELPLSPDQGIIVIDVGDSDQAPHQAYDHCYYGRIGGKSRPLNHRFVSDIFQRRRDPIVDLTFQIEERRTRAAEPFAMPEMPWMSSSNDRPGVRFQREVEILATATNRGKVLARYVSVSIELPRILIPRSDWDDDDTVVASTGDAAYVWEESNTRRDVIGVKNIGIGPVVYEYGPSWFDPLLPRRSQTWIKHLSSKIDIATLSSDLTISWEISADNAPSSSGSILLSAINRTKTEPLR